MEYKIKAQRATQAGWKMAVRGCEWCNLVFKVSIGYKLRNHVWVTSKIKNT